MKPFEPYSARRKRAQRAGQPTVYQYDAIPKRMRAQAFHVLVSAGGTEFEGGDFNPFWLRLEQRIMREHGYVHHLPTKNAQSMTNHSYDRVSEYLMTVETEWFLDVVELGMRESQLPMVKYLKMPYFQGEIEAINQATAELNSRFGQHDLGYSFVGFPGTLVRVDTKYVHAEVVEPTISQLGALEWHGPLNEFLSAHRHYRHADYKSAMNEALKAFESTMKAILEERQLEYEGNWQARNLIKALFDYGLIPSSLESFFSGIRTVLESGVPALRNKQSGHGQGTSVTEVPEYMAAYTLHLTASNILFLLSAHDPLPLVRRNTVGSIAKV